MKIAVTITAITIVMFFVLYFIECNFPNKFRIMAAIGNTEATPGKYYIKLSRYGILWIKYCRYDGDAVAFGSTNDAASRIIDMVNNRREDRQVLCVDVNSPEYKALMAVKEVHE